MACHVLCEKVLFYTNVGILAHGKANDISDQSAFVEEKDLEKRLHHTFMVEFLNLSEISVGCRPFQILYDMG